MLAFLIWNSWSKCGHFSNWVCLKEPILSFFGAFTVLLTPVGDYLDTSLSWTECLEHPITSHSTTFLYEVTRKHPISVGCTELAISQKTCVLQSVFTFSMIWTSPRWYLFPSMKMVHCNGYVSVVVSKQFHIHYNNYNWHIFCFQNGDSRLCIMSVCVYTTLHSELHQWVVHLH